MEEILLEAASSQGIWVILFVVLLIYVMKSNEKMSERQNEREENYQARLSEMTQKYSVIEEIAENVEIILGDLENEKQEGEERNG